MPIPLDLLPDVRPATFSKDTGAVAATSTFSVMACANATGEVFRVTGAHLLVDATYAADVANFYALALVHNSITLATWSTQTSAQGTLTAFTDQLMILAADTGTSLTVQPGEVLTLVATKNASAANLTVRVVVHGRFVK